MDSHSQPGEPAEPDSSSRPPPRPVPPEPRPDAESESRESDGSPHSPDTASPHSSPSPTVHREGDAVVVEHGGLLPSETCIRCGRPAKREVAIALRHPAKPTTWFGRRPIVDFGLCRSHFENRMVFVALTWSTLGVGVLLLLAGIVVLSAWTCAFGAALMAIAGVFRASFPVTARDADDYRIGIHGAGEAFLRRLPEGSDGRRD